MSDINLIFDQTKQNTTIVGNIIKGQTLHALMDENIGQMRIDQAQAEIDRLNKQEGTTAWHKDHSRFMFVPDETDDEMNNPCELINDDYCWVTKSFWVSNRKVQAQR